MADLISHAEATLDAFNRADWDEMRSLIAGSTYNEVGTQRVLTDPDETIQAFKGWKTAMPDAIGTITKAVASGQDVVLEVTWTGTHTGPMETPDGVIPASGRHQTTRGAFVFEYEGDKLKESRNYFDLLTFLQQIGAA